MAITTTLLLYCDFLEWYPKKNCIYCKYTQIQPIFTLFDFTFTCGLRVETLISLLMILSNGP